MAHSAVWGYFPIQKQSKNSKRLTEEELSENGHSRYTKFGRAHLIDQVNIRHSLTRYIIWDFFFLYV